MTSVEIKSLTDKKLHELCSTCGANIRKLQKEFAGYLHEVAVRGLYKRFGFYSLYEYAAKLAGMSHAVVDEIMAIHQKLEDKPILKDLITEQGWTKLKIVASSATPENQGFWAEKVREMSCSTLKTYIKELKKDQKDQTDIFTSAEDVSELRIDSSTPLATSQKSAITFKLDSNTETKLRIFKLRYEKRTGETQDWNRVIQELLKIAANHEDHKSVDNKTEILAPPNDLPQVSGRYIPANVKKYLIQKHEGKCAYPGCKKPAEIFHHTRRFALYPNHNPDYLVPLCKDHERLAHHGVIKNEEDSSKKWKIGSPDEVLYTSTTTVKYSQLAKSQIDKKVNRFRKPDG